MSGNPNEREFKPLQIAVMTVSDTRTEETDKSGALLVSRLSGAGIPTSLNISTTRSRVSLRESRL